MRNTIATTLLAAAVVFAGGCQTARVAEPLTRTVGGNDAGDQLEFWHGLADRPLTSNDEAFHGLLLFTDGQDPAADYAGRVDALKGRGMLAGSFAEPEDAAVSRGTVAVALAKALAIDGGVMMRMTRSAPRYAVRELQFLNVFPPSSENQTFSGAEFLGIIGKAEEFQKSATRGSLTVDVPAAEGGGHAPPAPEQGPTTGPGL